MKDTNYVLFEQVVSKALWNIKNLLQSSFHLQSVLIFTALIGYELYLCTVNLNINHIFYENKEDGLFLPNLDTTCVLW